MTHRCKKNVPEKKLKNVKNVKNVAKIKKNVDKNVSLNLFDFLPKT